MDLHLHLSAAFRALDREWGTPVDLDTSGEAYPCVPAVVELANTTFSSEIFLKKVQRNRPKPYSRTEERRRRSNVKLNDSFSNISVSRMSSYRDEEQKSINCTTRGSDTCERVEKNNLVEDSKKPLEETFVVSPRIGGSKCTLNASSQGKKQLNSALKELKIIALSYFGHKLKRKGDELTDLK